MDKFITPGKMPTPYQVELLTILMEECAEVQQRACKTLRFGVDEIQPEQPYDNTDRLSIEVGDLLTVIDMCIESGVINADIAQKQKARKMEKLKIFMQQEIDAGSTT